jgi:outer membrane murein-binding lipoprotein Lpp
MEFLPPSGWGDLVRRCDLDATERRLDAKIDALGARLDARIDELGARLDARIDAMGGRIDALEARIDRLERQIAEVRDEVRALGNLRTTIVLTGASVGISLFVGLGGLMVAMLQFAGS